MMRLRFFPLEKSAGYSDTQVLLMRNPPYALWLSILAGTARPVKAAAFWILLIVASIIASVRMLWMLAPDARPIGFTCWDICLPRRSLVLSLGRFPASYCLASSASFTGIAAGRSSRGCALRCWRLSRRSSFPLVWSYWCGLSFAGSTGWLWGRFMEWRWRWRCRYGSDLRFCRIIFPLFKNAVADSVFIPTISTLVRIGIGQHVRWVQFVPAILGGIWAIVYFARQKTQWDWNRQGPLLLLVSVCVAPYSWFPDEIVVLPAILAAAYCCAERDRSLVVAILDAAALLLVFCGVRVQTGAYIWTTTAWLGWYLFATRSIPEQRAPSSEVAAN